MVPLKSLFGPTVVGAETVNAGTINGQQQVTARAGRLRQRLASLELMKDAAERFPEMGRHDFIQYGAHLGVAGNRLYAVNAMQTFRPLKSPVVKGEQGRILERKHGKSAHQRVIQRDRSVGGPMIGRLVQILRMRANRVSALK